MKCSRLWMIFCLGSFLACLLFQKVFTEPLLFEDPYYQTILAKKIELNDVNGNYRTSYYAPLSQTHLFSSNPLIQSLWKLCVGSLAQNHVGKSEIWGPFLAKAIEKKEEQDEVQYIVTLNDHIYWQPLNSSDFSNSALSSSFLEKKELSSRDFKFSLDLIKNPFYDVPYAQKLKKKYEWIDSIEILDSKCLIVHGNLKQSSFDESSLFELTPLPAHIFLYDEKGASLIASENEIQESLAFANRLKTHWALHFIPSCGPWKIETLKANQVKLIKNDDFPMPHQALFHEMTFIQKGSEVLSWQAFKAGELDSHFLTPFQWKDYQTFLKTKSYHYQKERGLEIEKLEYLAPLYYFVGWNQKSSFFQDQRVRQAMSHAVPYDFILEELLMGLAERLTGPFMPESAFYNKDLKPISFDLEKASDLLKNAGFKKDSKSNRLLQQESGQPFRFTLLYYQQNELAALICQCLSNTLKELGIECILQGASYEGFLQKAVNHDFDALFMAWSLGDPLENLEEIWSEENLSLYNFIGFQNKKASALIQNLKEKNSRKVKEKLAQDLHQVIYEEQPYTFLYVPRQVFMYRSKLKNVFIPKEHQDILPGASDSFPCPRIFYFEKSIYETLPTH